MFSFSQSHKYVVGEETETIGCYKRQAVFLLQKDRLLSILQRLFCICFYRLY
jgi:hypothetical protein